MGVLPAQSFVKFFVLFLLVGESLANKGKLSVSYYDSTCPQADELVYQAVRKAAMGDQKVPARLLRMFFHDCFIRGCDGSVLLDGNGTEKTAPPNLSLGAFDVIDAAKAKVEDACPRTVSCADILAMAARDAVVLSGGPQWKVLKGRKDGRVSIAEETKELPPPNSTVTKLIQSFAKRGLSVGDLVVLSGAHTLGVSSCTSFSSRINTGNVDPAMDSKFATKLQGECSMLNAASGNTVFLDATAVKFDNNYYKRLTRGKGVLTSDQDLYNDARTRELVNLYGRHKGLFFSEFAASMVRMGNIGVKGEDGEVSLNCRVVN
ncbi:peroxidase 66-like [Nymphaea colorata]|nr:peroxidase 66-like [Nymphaea colorata]